MFIYVKKVAKRVLVIMGASNSRTAVEEAAASAGK